MSEQHAEIPNLLTTLKVGNSKKNIEPSLEPGDKVIYAIIRMHMDHESRECFPSISTIKKFAHCGQKKVTDAIERLKKAGLIKVESKKLDNGKGSNGYTVIETSFEKPFERFTPAFLMSDLPLHVKEYVMDTQQYMFIDKDSAQGNFSQSNIKQSKNTGGGVSEINKFDKFLIEQKLETQELSGKVDQAGFPIQKKSFDLVGLKQAALGIEAVNKQLTETQTQVDEVNEDVDLLKNEVNTLKQKDAIKDREMLKQREEISQLKKILIANGIDISDLDKNSYNF